MVFCVNLLLIQGVPLSVVPAFLFSLLLDVSMASDFLLGGIDFLGASDP
jgi:hypothetical protein